MFQRSHRVGSSEISCVLRNLEPHHCTNGFQASFYVFQAIEFSVLFVRMINEKAFVRVLLAKINFRSEFQSLTMVYRKRFVDEDFENHCLICHILLSTTWWEVWICDFGFDKKLTNRVVQ